jgi:cell division protein FtsI (penicillin-binding protein 3)
MISSKDRKPLLFSIVALCLLYCLLIFRFYQIQIVQGDHWKKVALSQHQFVSNIPAMRGSFYSNTAIKKGHTEQPRPFVLDVQKFHLFIDPDSVPGYVKEKMAKEMAAVVGVCPQWLKAELDKKSRSRKIATWLEAKNQLQILQWWEGFAKREKLPRNAIFFQPDYQRSYPFGAMLGTVLHTIQESKEPTGGLELVYNNYLSGKNGKRLRVRSPRHPLDGGKILEAPDHGADVYLTVNHYLQAILETELAKGVQAANAKGGWAAMMDPYTGEILALAQVPNFNPAKYADYYNDPALTDATKVRLVTDCFEPGSIFKPITAAICLKASEELLREGKKPVLSPEEWVPTSNGWFPGRTTPIKEVGRTHTQLNLNLGIQKSSNIYIARLAQRLIDAKGENWYRSELVNTFGFGKKSALGLPAESPGQVPTPGKLHPNGKLEWSVPTPYSLAMGHNILINGIQMLKAYALFANGGFEVQPHMVNKIVKDHKTLFQFTPPPKKQLLGSNVVSTIVHALKLVTKEGGTSKRADVPGFTEAGKSGTAEKVIDGVYSKTKNISSFIGFAPATNPRFVLLVSVDEPEQKFIPGVGRHQMGGICASPIFREIATRALHYLGVAPDDPYGYPTGDPRRDITKADMMLEIEKLKEEYLKRN